MIVDCISKQVHVFVVCFGWETAISATNASFHVPATRNTRPHSTMGETAFNHRVLRKGKSAGENGKTACELKIAN
jgi:hypothetical protein